MSTWKFIGIILVIVILALLPLVVHNPYYMHLSHPDGYQLGARHDLHPHVENGTHQPRDRRLLGDRGLCLGPVVDETWPACLARSARRCRHHRYCCSHCRCLSGEAGWIRLHYSDPGLWFYHRSGVRNLRGVWRACGDRGHISSRTHPHTFCGFSDHLPPSPRRPSII